MKTPHQSAAGFPHSRPLELLDDAVCDPYQIRNQLFEPSACTSCGAVYFEGCWQWTDAPANTRQIICPACKRIDDKLAAGHVSIEGRFAREYHEELRLLIDTLETRIKSQHPMQRIMAIEEHPDRLLITTTDIHLARSIGEALHQAYKGNLDFHYNETDYLLRVRWQRWV